MQQTIELTIIWNLSELQASLWESVINLLGWCNLFIVLCYRSWWKWWSPWICAISWSCCQWFGKSNWISSQQSETICV